MNSEPGHASVSAVRQVRRRVPRWPELRPFLRFQEVAVSPVERRLSRANTIDDLRRIARRRAPRAVFDYVDGGAEQEISLRRARASFEAVEFNPHVLRDVSAVDLTTTLLGGHAALPLVLAPTGFTRLMHHEGEIAVARAAARADIPYALATMGTTSIEDVRSCAPTARQWFQLYLWRDRKASTQLVERAIEAGYEALILTVDTQVGGARLRDVRNGFTVPPTLTPRSVASISLRPAWWLNLLTTDPLSFASLTSSDGTVEQLIGRMFDPTLNPGDLSWLRELWPGKLVVKGIQNIDDARLVVDRGADAIVVSNHGGRQLDRAPVPLELLPRVVDAVGDRCEVLVDTGITSGADIIAARAFGASAAMVGRAYLYGLMAAGERGVDHALKILRTEATRTMQLLGVTKVNSLTRKAVRLRQEQHLAARGVPRW
jgi:L-lactate dehydrogenase (cytochrome)